MILGLLIIGAGIALHLEDTRGLEQGESLALAAELGKAIKARTSTTPVLDDPVWSDCNEPDRCLSAIRQRTGASDVMLIRAFAAGARMRVTVERVGSGKEPISLDLTRDAESWHDPMRVATETLYLEGKAVLEVPWSPPPPPPSPSVGPYVVAGAGVAMLGAGIGFGLASASAIRDLEAGVQRASIADPAADSAATQAVVANVMFAAAGAAIVGGLMWWWLDPAR